MVNMTEEKRGVIEQRGGEERRTEGRRGEGNLMERWRAEKKSVKKRGR